MISTTLILIIVLAVLILWIISLFNRLITLRNRADEAWSDIEVQMKRRYDLIPNLVESVKGYAGHESSVFENVTKARTEAMQATSGVEHAQAENMLTSALKSVFAVAENYPQLQASQNFLHLQQELTDAEDKIQAARRFYNSNVRDLNTTIEVFPSNMIAGLLTFKKKEFFDAPDTVHKAPQVKF